jgi:hypothetical protein
MSRRLHGEIESKTIDKGYRYHWSDKAYGDDPNWLRSLMVLLLLSKFRTIGVFNRVTNILII